MRILLIEDSQEISNFLKTGLETECFAVDIAPDGETGLHLERINEYDAIILDYLLPKRNGQEVCLEIRRRNKNVPIIVLSAKSEISTKIKMLNAGADDYITKPFSFGELLARTRVLLRRSGEMKENRIKIGNLTLDTLRHLATKKGRKIFLTRKEFMLLELLMARLNQAVSRTTILEHVWDMNADHFSNTIDVHIRSLRKKIEEPGEKKIIVTLPGIGYRIES